MLHKQWPIRHLDKMFLLCSSYYSASITFSRTLFIWSFLHWAHHAPDYRVLLTANMEIPCLPCSGCVSKAIISLTQQKVGSIVSQSWTFLPLLPQQWLSVMFVILFAGFSIVITLQLLSLEENYCAVLSSVCLCGKGWAKCHARSSRFYSCCVYHQHTFCATMLLRCTYRCQFKRLLVKNSRRFRISFQNPERYSTVTHHIIPSIL